MTSVVKKKLSVPVRKFTSCVSGVKERDLWGKCRGKVTRRGKGGRNMRSTGHRSSHLQDPYAKRAYQADLDRERKQREPMNSQKNAERAAMRSHFRRKYQLPKNSKDSSHLRSSGPKVRLPRDLAAIVTPDSKSKGDAYSLLSAFQGLSFNVSSIITGEKNTKTTTPTPTPINGDCKVM
ncbi:complexin-3-like [Engraulis encrasicolus]|uniref:complexin-3-like n=1 Tax=Engraulis encrasicolus TaxID=184585 RepID=UPI002FD68B09